MSIANSLTDIIGRTPLLRLNRFSAESGIVNPIVAKIESFNPGRSVKDRIALAMIEDADHMYNNHLVDYYNKYMNHLNLLI